MGVLGRNCSPSTLPESSPPYIAGTLRPISSFVTCWVSQRMVLPKGSTISCFLAEARRFESQYVPIFNSNMLSYLTQFGTYLANTHFPKLRTDSSINQERSQSGDKH